MKYTPYIKLSRKERRKVDNLRRVTWGISPVTRRAENPRAYNRAKTRREERKLFNRVFAVSTDHNNPENHFKEMRKRRSISAPP